MTPRKKRSPAPLRTGTEEVKLQKEITPPVEKIQAQELLKLLGVKAVLLAVGAKKNPLLPKWSSLKFSQTQLPAYQKSLANAPSIGVLLGSASEGLCSIDFDCETYLDEFLELNPSLRETLQTKGKRGRNLWLIVDGEIPATKHLKRNSQGVGEWRSDKHQTVITGLHPDGLSYRIIVASVPQRVRFSDLAWPENDYSWPTKTSPQGDLLPPPPSIRLNTLNPLNLLNPLYHTRELADRENRARDALPPSVRKLYDRSIKNKFTPRQGQRNSDLVAMISFLFQAVGEIQLRAISEAYYDLNQSIFTDSKEQHTSEAEAIIKGRRKTWLADLENHERQFFDSLPCLHGQAFRICRDLSISSADNGEEWSFFLSYPDLGHRLNCHPMEAQRILATFERIGLMSIFEKGTQHSPTERGKATKWLWNAQVLEV